MSWLGALFIVAGFVAILRLSKLVPKSLQVVRVSRCALADLRNPELDDDGKEAAMQRHAKQLFGLFLLLQAGTAAAVLLPTACILLLDALNLISFHSVMETTLSWPFIGTTTALFLVVFLARKR